MSARTIVAMKPTRRRLALVAVLIALVAAACGNGDDDDSGAATTMPTPDRTVAITMKDIAFEPATLEVRRGETVRFEFTNTGAVAHDAFIGDKAGQDDHEKEMRDSQGDDMGGMDTNADEESAGAITVEPGGKGDLTYTFDEPGAVEVGCHQPGHYAAGMKIAVTVT